MREVTGAAYALAKTDSFDYYSLLSTHCNPASKVAGWIHFLLAAPVKGKGLFYAARKVPRTCAFD